MDTPNPIDEIRQAEAEARELIAKAKDAAKAKAAALVDEKDAELKAAVEKENRHNEDYLASLEKKIDGRLSAEEKKAEKNAAGLKKDRSSLVEEAAAGIVKRIIE